MSKLFNTATPRLQPNGLEGSIWRIQVWMGFSGPLGATRRMAFYSKLAKNERIGMPPAVTLRKMLEVRAKRSANDWYVRLLRAMVADIREGQSPITSALRRWVPAREVMVLAPGENTGKLPDALDGLVDLLARQEVAAGIVRQVAMQTVGLLAALLGAAIFIAKTIIAQLVDMIPPEVLGGNEWWAEYIRLSLWVEANWIWLPLIFVACLTAAVYSLPRWTPGVLRGALDRTVLPWRVYAQTTGASFLASAATLTRSGSSLKGIVANALQVAEPWERYYLNRMAIELAKGGSGEASALRCGMFAAEIEDELLETMHLPDFADIMDNLAKSAMSQLRGYCERVGALVKYLTWLVIFVFIFATMGTIFGAVFAYKATMAVGI